MTDGWIGVLAAPLLDPASRPFQPFIGVAFVVGAMFLWWSGRARGVREALWLGSGGPAWRHRSTALYVQILLARRAFVRRGGGAAHLGVAWVLATSLVRLLDRMFALPNPPAIPPVALTAVASVV